MHKLNIGLQLLSKYWKHFINYRSFHNYNNSIMKKSDTGIVFSNYMANLIPGCKVIYHGVEPSIPFIDKKEARKRLALTENGRIALLNGFLTATKGWDVVRKMDIPDGWTIVMNHSRFHYSREIIDIKKDFKNNKIISLNKNYISDPEFSLLLFASDVVLLPYKVSSGSGVMFDALAHGIPFIASDLEFFKEFSRKGLGMCVKRKPENFAKALLQINNQYEKYSININSFKNNLNWDLHASKHIEIYKNLLSVRKHTLLKSHN